MHIITDLEISKLLGFDENIIGKEFKIKRNSFKILRFNIHRTKFPIDIINIKTNKITVCGVELVKNNLI